MEPIESSETSAYINTLTPGTYPKEKKLQAKNTLYFWNSGTSSLFIHYVVCLATGLQHLPKRGLHIGDLVLSHSLNIQYIHPSLRSPRSFLRHLSRRAITVIFLSVFSSITLFRRQIHTQNITTHLPFLLCNACRILLSSFTLRNTLHSSEFDLNYLLHPTAASHLRTFKVFLSILLSVQLAVPHKTILQVQHLISFFQSYSLLRQRVRFALGAWMSSSYECCQVQVSATGRTLVQRNPTECGVCD